MSVYKAFIVKAANHCGYNYSEMEDVFRKFYPIDVTDDNQKYLEVSQWNSSELDQFIAKATYEIGDNNFKF